MIFSRIQESGTNDVLRWAIKNGANIKEDRQLQSIINDETFYLITMDDVNFLELFRLTQIYREKVRVIEEAPADIPPRKDLIEIFHGEFVEDPENNPEKKVPLHELVEYSAQTFINLALQMRSDDNIIRPETVRLFLPMLTRKFVVQIPISFMDIVSFMKDNEEAKKIFNENYPNTLTEQIVEAEQSNVRNMIYLGMMRSTSIVRYDAHYDQLINLVKYTPLKKAQSNKLYKFRMTGFFKYDNVSRGESRCSMFYPDKAAMSQTMKKLSHLSTPLKVEFVVQLPIQYMEMILNSFSQDELGVAYESSMSSIIESGIEFDDFITHNYDESSEDPEEQTKIEVYNNSINGYQTRINEANQIALNTIPILIQNDGDVDITSAFALLPSIYTTKAVLTINTENAQKYLNHSDPTIASMFKEMIDICYSLKEDIARNK